MDDSGLQREKEDQRKRAEEIAQKDEELMKLKFQEEPFMTKDKEVYYRRIGELERRLGELRYDESQALDRWMREQQNASQRLQDLRMRDMNTMDPRTRDNHLQDLQRFENRAEVYRELERTLRDEYMREFKDKDAKLTKEIALKPVFYKDKEKNQRAMKYLEPRVTQLRNIVNYRPPPQGYGPQNNYPPPPPPPPQGYQQQPQYNQPPPPPPPQQQQQQQQPARNNQNDLAGCCIIL